MARKSSNIRNLSLILLAVILVGIGVLYFVYAPYIKTGSLKKSNTSTKFERPKKLCEVYGTAEKGVLGDLLDTYTVKHGDTLISVAKNVLNDPSSVGDLVSLNKDRYPGLLEKGLIEVGWELYLPDKELEKRNYTYVWKASGNLHFIGNDKFGIKSQTDYVMGAKEIGSNMRKDLVGIKEGDCVVVYIGQGTGFNGEVYLIKKQ